MLKALINEARVRVDITTKGPLLIKTGYATVIGADMAPVQAYRHGHQEIYLPGSSLKGVFRSHVEKVANSIKPRVVCNPLVRNEERNGERSLYRPSCGGRFTDKDPSHKVYAGSCPTCRLFGSTSFVGRISVEDAYLPEGAFEERKLIEHRDGIAIDRLTGGVSGRFKFDLETVTAGTTFTTMLHLRNFEIWQLGMLFVFLQDMEDELIALGSGRSRGLGKVSATINEEPEKSHPGGMVLTTVRTGPKSQEPANELWGLGHWLQEKGEKPETYKTKPDDLLTLDSPLAQELKKGSLRFTRAFKGSVLDDLKTQCIEAFVARMQTWSDNSSVPAGR